MFVSFMLAILFNCPTGDLNGDDKTDLLDYGYVQVYDNHRMVSQSLTELSIRNMTLNLRNLEEVIDTEHMIINIQIDNLTVVGGVELK